MTNVYSATIFVHLNNHNIYTTINNSNNTTTIITYLYSLTNIQCNSAHLLEEITKLLFNTSLRKRTLTKNNKTLYLYALLISIML